MILNLAETARERTRQALAAGTLGPIDTEATVLHDHGLPFVLRIIANLARKKAATRGAAGNPFLPPYETGLYVGDLSATHVALLNKFPVLDRHLLFVTREYESQDAALVETDCHALLLGLREIDGLAFYNGGRLAGASQPHKHLQLVPLPLAPVGPPLPFADALAGARAADGFARVPDWPFRHLAAPMNPDWLARPDLGARALATRYRAMLEALGLNRPGGDPAPYNLLATRDWMWLVPRRAECAAGISVNALGFAGALLAPDRVRRDALVEAGPTNILVAVTGARDDSETTRP